MTESIIKGVGYLFSFVFLIVSCAGTDFKETRVDDADKGNPVSNILIIAVTGNEHNRRSYERKFVAHLKSVGVEAVASEKSIPMPGDLKLKTETILNTVDQYKNDAVIITQLVGKETDDIYQRGGVTRHGYFSYTRNPGYSSTITKVRLETNLYDAKTGERIWSGRSKTLSKDSTDRIMNDVIKTVIANLKKNRLIAPD